MALLDDTGIINGVVTAMGLKALPLIRTNAAVVLGMVYNYLPYMIMPLYTVIMKIDPRLVEAAEDLGCNSAQVFRRVIFPLSVPGIISGFTMVFVPAVSTFYISQKLGSSGTTLIGDVIESQFKTAYNPNLGAALSLVLMVLVFICIGIMPTAAAVPFCSISASYPKYPSTITISPAMAEIMDAGSRFMPQAEPTSMPSRYCVSRLLGIVGVLWKYFRYDWDTIS